MNESCSLTATRCVPCEGGVPPLDAEAIASYLPQIPAWTVQDHRLVREVERTDFAAILALVNRLGALAEEHGHHPNLYLHDYRKLRIDLYTHAIGGLSVNDFVLAAHFEQEIQAKS